MASEKTVSPATTQEPVGSQEAPQAVVPETTAQEIAPVAPADPVSSLPANRIKDDPISRKGGEGVVAEAQDCAYARAAVLTRRKGKGVCLATRAARKAAPPAFGEDVSLSAGDRVQLHRYVDVVLVLIPSDQQVIRRGADGHVAGLRDCRRDGTEQEGRQKKGSRASPSSVSPALHPSNIGRFGQLRRSERADLLYAKQTCS